MAKKVTIWIATAPFSMGGVEYETGDEWVQTPEWTYDEALSELNRRPTFTRTKVIKSKGKTTDSLDFHTILPVKPRPTDKE